MCLERADFAKFFIFYQKCCKVSDFRCLCYTGVGSVCVLAGETLQMLKSHGYKAFLVQPLRPVRVWAQRSHSTCWYGCVTSQDRTSCWAGLLCAGRDDFLSLWRGGKQSLSASFAVQTPEWNPWVIPLSTNPAWGEPVLGWESLKQNNPCRRTSE